MKYISKYLLFLLAFIILNNSYSKQKIEHIINFFLILKLMSCFLPIEAMSYNRKVEVIIQEKILNDRIIIFKYLFLFLTLSLVSSLLFEFDNYIYNLILGMIISFLFMIIIHYSYNKFYRKNNKKVFVN